MEHRRAGGGRVALEPLRPELAQRLRELRAAPEVARWWGLPEEGWFFEESDPDDRYRQNERAIHVYAKLGFRRVGVLR